MGWRGALRSITAAARAAERDAQRRAKARQRYLAAVQHATDLQQAAQAVREYQEYILSLVSIHKTGSDPVDWRAQVLRPAPAAPPPTQAEEEAARRALDSYRPGFFARHTGRGERCRQCLMQELDAACEKDAAANAAAERKFQQDLAAHSEQRELAEHLLAGDCETLIEAVQEFNPFSAITAIGSSVSMKALPNLRMEVEIQVHGAECIPKQALTLLKSGRASSKAVPKGEYSRLHQDYICSAVLRVARELFAITPISAVTVTATDLVLCSTTGNLERKPLLSAFIPRATFEQLNLDRLDPSDSFCNFIHNMDFRPSSGLRPVEALDPERVGLSA